MPKRFKAVYEMCKGTPLCMGSNEEIPPCTTETRKYVKSIKFCQSNSLKINLKTNKNLSCFLE